MQTQIKVKQPKTSVRPLHKYVVFGVGLWFLFIVTFAIAHLRVSQSGKFNGLPLKSLTESQPQKPVDSY
ncbi:hypothetical protein [Acaryochloris sp. IP29b_bin.137]|uniref:hypothetical protein n=1 Tax=Acaryochloris sp. IP29b_bin.137 TaxID=2969217 RepID=UPI002615D0BC|nr:hypothetical protein [Acaryochloris sp. IP29b_bin.137]